MTAKHVLRRLLRAIDKNLTSVAGNKQWREYVLTEFRANTGLCDSVAKQQALQKASDYELLITSIAEHRELLRTYNIGLDPDERNQKMVEATAKRVGFALPPEQFRASAAASVGHTGSTANTAAAGEGASA